jgi:hypothetical protein
MAGMAAAPRRARDRRWGDRAPAGMALHVGIGRGDLLGMQVADMVEQRAGIRP